MTSTDIKSTNIDTLVFRFAGIFVLLSLTLAHFHHPYWLWFTVFVGINLVQASFSGFCPLVIILRKLGVKPGTAFTCGVKNL